MTTTFGLVHGAHHGGWCWDRVVPDLAALGFESVAPDLPCDDPAAGLSEYADAVLAALEGRDDVMLVGHSLGSLVIPIVARRRPVRRLVYLCSAPTPPGIATGEELGAMVRPEFLAAPRFTDADGRQLLDNASARALFYHDCTDEDVWWALGHLRPQSVRPLAEPSPLDRWPDVPVSVILTADDRTVASEWAIPVARKATDGREPVMLEGSHSPFVSRPAVLARALAAEATRSGAAAAGDKGAGATAS